MGQLKCICQLCTCGRHRCPHARSSTFVTSNKPCAIQTEYDSVYKSWGAVKRRTPLRPTEQQRLKRVEMDMVTSYADNFGEKPIPVQTKKDKEKYSRPTQDMYMDTTYRETYTDRGAPPQRTSRRPPTTQWSVREGPEVLPLTETQSKFKQVSVDEMRTCKSAAVNHKETIVLRGGTPVNGGHVSTVQADYVPHGAHSRPAPIIPHSEEHISGPFDSRTTYKVEFYKKPTEKIEPVKKVTYKPNTGTFFGETTVRADYKGYKNHKGRDPSFKPPQKFHSTGLPFEGQTVYTDTYKKYERVVRPALCFDQQKYKKPKEKMEDSTFYRETYKEFLNHQRTTPVYPRTDPRQVGPFQGVTSHMVDYPGREPVARAKSFKIIQVYQPPQQQVDGISIQKLHYKGETAPRAEICRPVVNRRCEEGGDMIFRTNYTDVYTGQQPAPCPAADPATRAPDAKTTITRNGHVFPTTKA